ncbi:hypothetical protein ACIBQX_47105 [Nonomuraea sp. NPDC049714]|uniref:hypothetical protein n=1 Tax=Nonomuraea sp. NPDC049714 TaxID=3364357 RepID=UPI003795D334
MNAIVTVLIGVLALLLPIADRLHKVSMQIVTAEKNSTLVLPFPAELLRFLERSTPAAPEQRAAYEPSVLR